MILSDLRQGIRALAHHPLMAVTTVVALAVGIGLSTVGFATMEAMLFSRLPYEDGDRWVRITPVSAQAREPVALTPEGYAEIAGFEGLVHVGASTGGRDSVTLPDGRLEPVTLAAMTPSTFAHLPAAPIRGRLLTSTDARPGQPPVAMVSEHFWRRSLGADEAALGSQVTIGTTTYAVVGMLPESFKFPNAPDVWLPLDEGFLTGVRALDGDARIFGIRSPAITVDALQAGAAALSTHVAPARGTDAVVVDVVPYTDIGPMAADLSAVIVLVVTAVLLVIAANVGNLVLARSFARTREFALRSALGASRGRLIAQVGVEVLLLGLVAAGLGTIAADAALRQFNTMEELPFWVDFRGGPMTAVLVAGATLVATLVAGVWPAFRATRRDLVAGLHAVDGRSSDVRFGRAAGAMVIVQIAVSVVMLHGALVVAQGFRDYTNVHLDLPANVLTMGISVNARTVAMDGHRPAPLAVPEAEEIARGLPGVIAVGAASALPRHSPAPRLVELEGPRVESGRRAPSAWVTPSYFDALAATPLAGRLFTETDVLPGAAPVVVVNEPFVARILGGAPAVGRRLRVIEEGQDGRPGPWRDIVGVVPDLGLSVGDPSMAAGFYEPMAADRNVVYLALRVNGDPMTYAEPLRRALHDRHPEMVPYRAERLEDVASDDRAFFAGFSSALVGLGTVTLVLALVGVYSMMSIIVSRRTREIGIRLALGATTDRIVRTIAGRAAVQVLIGGGVGTVLAVLSLQGRSMLVSRLGDGGRWTLPVVLSVLILGGLGATWVPLRRALGVRPQDSLRAE